MGIILSSFIRAYGLLLGNKLIQAAHRPDTSQKEFLLRIINKNKGTEYGRKFSFSAISDEKEFRNNVPVVEYNDLDIFIDKIKKGQRNVLTKDPVVMFTLTSGTTARPKYIPITAQGQKRTARLMRQWLCHALSDHPAYLDKGFLSITGAAVEGHTEGRIPYGSASGMIYTTFPRIVHNSFVIPFPISEIADYDMRYYLMARFAYWKPISFIATPNPLTLVKLAETAHIHQEDLIRSMHNGWLSEKLQTKQHCADAGVPDSLKFLMKPDKARARFLVGILERTGKLLPVDCWPELKLLSCWLGGSIGFHADSLTAYYGIAPRRDIGYMASEGCITLPVRDSTPAGLLALFNNYYEFIPEEQIDSTQPDILPAHETEVGKCYKLLLTNENGLYRYDIDDIVKVEDRYRNTPILSFVRKSGNILSIAGEKLHLNHFLIAIGKLKSQLTLDIQQFRAIPDPEKLRYEVFLDVRTIVLPEFVRSTILPVLDTYLCECNIEYDSKRKSKRLNAPCIHIMNASWEDNMRSIHIRAGKRDIQYKWLQLSSQRIEEDYQYINFSVE